MDLTSLPLLDVLRARMSWLNARQGVLAQNVANADTPGYTTQDIKPLDFSKVLAGATSKYQTGLTTTDPKHISLSSTATPEGLSPEDLQATPSDQSVSAEEEMIKVSDTQSQYQAAANIYAKAIGMMRTAIGNP